MLIKMLRYRMYCYYIFYSSWICIFLFDKVSEVKIGLLLGKLYVKN